MFNLLKRIMIYGYLFFIGYQTFLLLQDNNDKKLADAIQNFENRHNHIFNKVYQYIPQLAASNLKFIKYPVAIMGFSGLSVLFGCFGLFALASHALLVYLTNEKFVKIVNSISRTMNVYDFIQSIDLEIIVLLALYLGIIHQIVSGLFCCGKRKNNCSPIKEQEKTIDVPQRETRQTSQKQKKKL